MAENPPELPTCSYCEQVIEADHVIFNKMIFVNDMPDQLVQYTFHNDCWTPVESFVDTGPA